MRSTLWESFLRAILHLRGGRNIDVSCAIGFDNKSYFHWTGYGFVRRCSQCLRYVMNLVEILLERE